MRRPRSAAGRLPPRHRPGLPWTRWGVSGQFHTESEGITMRDEVCFGYLSISIQGDVGAVTLDPDFAGSEDDQHDWDDAMEWCWARGLRLASEDPALATGDGTQIFLLRDRCADLRPQAPSAQRSGPPRPRAGRRRQPGNVRR